jgi:hypothetical protein
MPPSPDTAAPISDEAVEAAAKSLFDLVWAKSPGMSKVPHPDKPEFASVKAWFDKQARAALEAAAPFMEAVLTPSPDTAALRKFRKKPVEVDAMRWNGTPHAATPIIDWILNNGGTARWHEHEDGRSTHIAIDTLEGVMSADIGDWIIRGVKGEFYPCKPDIFEATYDPLP